MADGISEETGRAVGGFFQDPCERGVWPRPFCEDGIIVAEIGGEGLVELEDGLRRFPLLPIALGEGEGI